MVVIMLLCLNIVFLLVVLCFGEGGELYVYLFLNFFFHS